MTLRVIDACARYLYGERGVRVEDDVGIVHRLLEYRASWVARCGYVYGDAGERLETRAPITCISCASGR